MGSRLGSCVPHALTTKSREVRFSYQRWNSSAWGRSASLLSLVFGHFIWGHWKSSPPPAGCFQSLRQHTVIFLRLSSICLKYSLQGFPQPIPFLLPISFFCSFFFKPASDFYAWWVIFKLCTKYDPTDAYKVWTHSVSHASSSSLPHCRANRHSSSCGARVPPHLGTQSGYALLTCSNLWFPPWPERSIANGSSAPLPTTPLHIYCLFTTFPKTPSPHHST